VKTPTHFFVTSLAVAAMSVAGAQGQNRDTVPDVSLPCTKAHRVQSRITGRTYPIDVALPPAYCANPTDTTRYPTLYLLDNLMRVATPWFRYRALGGSIREPGLIMVGIGWPAPPAGVRDPQYWRIVEYTTPITVSDSRSGSPVHPADSFAHVHARAYMRKFQPSNGGEAPQFLRVIQEEIIPFIEKTYRVTPDRGLFGHSAGGYFATYALFEAPGTFTRYGISSPMFMWDDYAIMTREDSFARTHDVLQKSVVLVAGADEIQASADMYRMAATLTAREYKGLKLSVRLVPGGHLTSAGLFEAINTLYPIVR
jgi:uncharacterized protein